MSIKEKKGIYKDLLELEKRVINDIENNEPFKLMEEDRNTIGNVIEILKEYLYKKRIGKKRKKANIKKYKITTEKVVFTEYIVTANNEQEAKEKYYKGEEESSLEYVQNEEEDVIEIKAIENV